MFYGIKLNTGYELNLNEIEFRFLLYKLTYN